tara:strand:- start:43 stop:612 length:570 start_codon:yes stop_codon:yes gene_type:complete
MIRNDRKSPSQLKKPVSIGWKKEIRKTPVDALEIMAIENENWKKEQQKEINHYRNLGHLDDKNNIIEESLLGLPEPWYTGIRAKLLKTKMTKIEWENYCKKQEMMREKKRNDYLKNNKMDKSIVNKILDFFEDKEYVKNNMKNKCPCNNCFALSFDPINKFNLTEDDWYYGLYDDLINGQLNKIFNERV